MDTVLVSHSLFLSLNKHLPHDPEMRQLIADGFAREMAKCYEHFSKEQFLIQYSHDERKFYKLRATKP